MKVYPHFVYFFLFVSKIVWGQCEKFCEWKLNNVFVIAKNNVFFHVGPVILYGSGNNLSAAPQNKYSQLLFSNISL